MFLIYYCYLVDYAIRLTCKCIVFFVKRTPKKAKNSKIEHLF